MQDLDFSEILDDEEQALAAFEELEEECGNLKHLDEVRAELFMKLVILCVQLEFRTRSGTSNDKKRRETASAFDYGNGTVLSSHIKTGNNHGLTCSECKQSFRNVFEARLKVSQLLSGNPKLSKASYTGNSTRAKSPLRTEDEVQRESDTKISNRNFYLRSIRLRLETAESLGCKEAKVLFRNSVLGNKEDHTASSDSRPETSQALSFQPRISVVRLILNKMAEAHRLTCKSMFYYSQTTSRWDHHQILALFRKAVANGNSAESLSVTFKTLENTYETKGLLEACAEFGFAETIEVVCKDDLECKNIPMSECRAVWANVLTSACKGAQKGTFDKVYSLSKALSSMKKPAGLWRSSAPSPLHYLSLFSARTDLEAMDNIVSKMLDWGFDINITYNVKEPQTLDSIQIDGTPLHAAARLNCEAAVRCLLSHGADPYLCYNSKADGRTLSASQLAASLHLAPLVAIMFQHTRASDLTSRAEELEEVIRIGPVSKLKRDFLSYSLIHGTPETDAQYQKTKRVIELCRGSSESRRFLLIPAALARSKDDFGISYDPAYKQNSESMSMEDPSSSLAVRPSSRVVLKRRRSLSDIRIFESMTPAELKSTHKKMYRLSNKLHHFKYIQRFLRSPMQYPVTPRVRKLYAEFPQLAAASERSLESIQETDAVDITETNSSQSPVLLARPIPSNIEKFLKSPMQYPVPPSARKIHAESPQFAAASEGSFEPIQETYATDITEKNNSQSPALLAQPIPNDTQGPMTAQIYNRFEALANLPPTKPIPVARKKPRSPHDRSIKLPLLFNLS